MHCLTIGLSMFGGDIQHQNSHVTASNGKPPKGCRRSKTKVAKNLKVAKGLSTAHNDSHLAYILRPLLCGHNGSKAIAKFCCKVKSSFQDEFVTSVSCAELLNRGAVLLLIAIDRPCLCACRLNSLVLRRFLGPVIVHRCHRQGVLR